GGSPWTIWAIRMSPQITPHPRRQRCAPREKRLISSTPLPQGGVLPRVTGRLCPFLPLGRGGKASGIGHDVQRSLFDLLVDATDVCGDDANRNQLHASEKKHRHDERSPPGHPPVSKELKPEGI